MPANPEFRCGYVAIAGAPNVGKSTLLNLLIGQKLSIVTHKPQTTRRRILGILSGESSQVILFDTPGLVEPRYRLHEYMMDQARSALNDADLILLMVDASAVPEAESDLGLAAIANLAALPSDLRKPVFLVLNKTDLVSKQDLLMLIATYSARYPFEEVFPLSALKGEGIEPLLPAVTSRLPVHPALYPPDVLSDQPDKFFVGEIIREKIFEEYREEIPYSTTVTIASFEERAGKKTVIGAEIYVERDSQKGILVGKGGLALKRVGETARKDIEKFLGQKVFLSLHVRVRDQWRKSEAWLRRLGYSGE
jgi:GTP-binding protein Era